MLNIADKLTLVRTSIVEAAKNCQRDSNDITLLAVSKTQPFESIRQAVNAGQRDFGENYLQEAIEKIHQCENFPITWHFIGHIQTNKTRIIAEHFSWVHTIDRIKIAKRLGEQRPKQLAPLQVCIQVNIDQQTTKGGCRPDDVQALAWAIGQQPRLKLRGLMAIPSPAQPRQAFTNLRRLCRQLQSELKTELDTLSMGMSADMTQAIHEGSTCVRIGTAIFGTRKTQAVLNR